MRNISLAVVAAVTLCLLAPAVIQAAPAGAAWVAHPALEPDLTQIQPGLADPDAPVALELEVYVQNAANLGGLEFDVLYDRTKAQITGITPASMLGQPTQCDPNTIRCATGLGPAHRSDRSRIGAFSYGAAAGATGAGLLAVIHVQTSGDPATLTFTLANPLVVDVEGNPITEAVTLSLRKRSGAQLFLPMIGR